ncbi:MAG: endonuclease III [Candidatus Tectimicrobiota bacterium]
MTLQQTRGRLRDILTILQETYPDAACALHFTTPLELLIATILSAQCTDAQVNRVTPELFQKYRTAAEYATIAGDTLAADIRSTGFYRQKARLIQRCCEALVLHHNGRVPDTMEALIRLPGIGRKTANVVLGNAFHKTQGIAVDTHVQRLAQRLALTSATHPDTIEQDLLLLVPRKAWTLFSHLLISHGRTLCKARAPRCVECPLHHFCNMAQPGSASEKRVS